MKIKPLPQAFTPTVSVQAGTEIGYSSSWTRGMGKNLVLASSEEKIDLAPGYHLLLARNGRGKTTFLKTLAGCITPLSGGVKVSGGIQYISEELRFDPELTARAIFRSLFTRQARGIASDLSAQLELPITTIYGNLSKGNKQKLAIIIAETKASVEGAQVILLDEPFSGIDFHTREKIAKMWVDSDHEHVRIICIHPDEQTLQADSALTINNGKLEWSSTEAGVIDWGQLKTELH